LQQVIANREATISQALPTANLRTSAQYSELPGGAGFGGFGNLAGFPQQGGVVDNTLSANMVLFDGFVVRDTLGILDRQILISRLAEKDAQQNAMLTTANSYFDVLKAIGQKEVALAGLTQVKSQLTLTELRFKAGTATKADVLAIKANLALSEANYNAAQNAISLGQLSLANSLNQTELKGDLDLSPRIAEIKFKPTDLSQAIQRRLDVQQANENYSLDKANIELTSRAFLPNLTTGTSYAARGLNQGQFSVNVNLNWSIFDGFVTRNRVTAAEKKAATTEILLKQTLQNVALEIRRNLQLKDDAKNRLESAQKALENATESFRLAQKRYEIGLGTAFELNDFRSLYTNAQTTYLNSLHDWRLAQLRLAKSIGLDLMELVK
jgi:outer membrane protein